MIRAHVWWLAAIVIGLPIELGCDSTPARTLAVRLVADFVPGEEVRVAETELFALESENDESGIRIAHIERDLRDDDALSGGLTIATLTDVADGVYALGVSLRGNDPALQPRRTLRITVSKDDAIVVHLTRDCANVQCATAQACVSGQCVDARCSAQDRTHCPVDVLCDADQDCTTDSACAIAACVQGQCVTQARANACLASEWCAPEIGCVPDEHPVTPINREERCGTICPLTDSPCHYGYYACTQNRDGTTRIECAPLVARPENAPCGADQICNAQHECVAQMLDAGVPDASLPDSGVRDANAPDARLADGSALDAHENDAASHDASLPDAHAPDADVLVEPDAHIMDASGDPADAGPAADASIDAAAALDAADDAPRDAPLVPVNECTDFTDTCTQSEHCEDLAVGYACRQIVAMATGDGTCAVFQGGALKCWSGGSPQGAPVNMGTPTNTVEVDTMAYATCALQNGGALLCWGSNYNGQVGSGDTAYHYAWQPVEVSLGSGHGVTAVSIGSESTCAIRDDGELYCWGANANGQLGVGDTSPHYSPTHVEVDPDHDVVQVDVGQGVTCARLDNGTVKCWGAGSTQLGYGDVTQRTTPSSAVIDFGVGRTATQIVVGGGMSCARLDDHTTKCWGANNWGQLGYGDIFARSAPPSQTVDFGGGHFAIALFSSFYQDLCAILDDGSLSCWGYNSEGQLGVGDVSARLSPTHVDLGGRIVNDVSMDGRYTCVTFQDDHSMKCWGTAGYLGYGLTTRLGSPGAVVDIGGDAIDVAGELHTCAVREDGEVFCWGRNDTGQLGLGDTTARATASNAVMGLGDAAISVAATYGGTCALRVDGKIECWGNGWAGELGYGDNLTRLNPNGSTVDLGINRTATSIVAGYSHFCAMLDNADIVCWGYNEGQLGTGDTLQRDVPTLVPLSEDAAHLSAGSNRTCVVTASNALYCWGYNGSGQLGYGDTTNRTSVPMAQVDVGIGRYVTQLNMHVEHTCVLLDDGTSKCWGYNGSGQLGYGDSMNRSAPAVDTILHPLGAVQSIVPNGLGGTCALYASGNIACWGAAWIGYPDSASYSSPPNRAINFDGRNAVRLMRGNAHACAILDDGSVRCWGDNANGQLGDPSNVFWAPPARTVNLDGRIH